MYDHRTFGRSFMLTQIPTIFALDLKCYEKLLHTRQCAICYFYQKNKYYITIFDVF